MGLVSSDIGYWHALWRYIQPIRMLLIFLAELRCLGKVRCRGVRFRATRRICLCNGPELKMHAVNCCHLHITRKHGSTAPIVKNQNLALGCPYQLLWIFPHATHPSCVVPQVVVYAVSKGAVRYPWRRSVDGPHRNPWLVSINNWKFGTRAVSPF